MSEPHFWLRGPVAGVPLLLQPVAHSLLQCRADMHAAIAGLTPAQLSARPGGAAAIGYHARHAMGSLDRLFSYARGEELTQAQREALAAEGSADPGDDTVSRLSAAIDRTTEAALRQLRATDEATLLEAREVGRARLPSTVLGLLFHAAEHTQRHAGQLVTTAKIVRGGVGASE